MPTEANKNRVKYMDCARAFSMIWIVGVWHLVNYMGVSLNSKFFEFITFGVLGTFTYISGYFLGGRLVSNLADAISFIVKRLVRFYPLYFLSCTSLYLLHIIMDAETITSFRQYILTLVGMAGLFPPMPSTIWYICMMLFFYLLTPVINAVKIKKYKLGVCALIYAVFLVMKLTLGIDYRILLWFPMYCVGLLTSGMKFREEVQIAPTVTAAVLFCLISVLADMKILAGGGTAYVEFLVSALFVIILLQISKLFAANRKLCGILSAASYGSMCAYLFHRQWYGLLKSVLGTLNIFEGVGAFLLLMVGSYIVQKIYDRIVRTVSLQNNRKYI